MSCIFYVFFDTHLSFFDYWEVLSVVALRAQWCWGISVCPWINFNIRFLGKIVEFSNCFVNVTCQVLFLQTSTQCFNRSLSVSQCSSMKHANPSTALPWSYDCLSSNKGLWIWITYAMICQFTWVTSKQPFCPYVCQCPVPVNTSGWKNVATVLPWPLRKKKYKLRGGNTSTANL